MAGVYHGEGPASDPPTRPAPAARLARDLAARRSCAAGAHLWTGLLGEEVVGETAVKSAAVLLGSRPNPEVAVMRADAPDPPDDSDVTGVSARIGCDAGSGWLA